MEKLMVRERFLAFDWDGLSAREETDRIIVHHTGGAKDDDAGAEDVHRMHEGLGWNGIGYHFVVRKDGTIEAGRPHRAVGAHAEGENWRALGIVLSGNFECEEPTKEQIESAALLAAHLAAAYAIPLDDGHVLGHRDVDATACPGRNLYVLLPILIGKAIWYWAN